jgi:tyrosyl-tRNA synthetase
VTLPDRSEFFERAVAEVIERPVLEALLASARKLRWKHGLDPTRPDLHLGHAVGLRKLRQGALWGHEVVLIVGDYTAQIGDPTAKDETRAVLSHEEVLQNAETYLAQFHRIVPQENVRIIRQSEWYGSFSLQQTVELASRFTAQQMLAREEFKKRLAEARPIPIKDLLYPLLQAYDSVAIEADIEFGGTDQKFNILLGRELQEQLGKPPQQVFLWHLLPGLDGEKMSKTKRHTGIWLTDPPDEMYGKVMKLGDELMPIYFDWATEMPLVEARRTVAALKDGSLHPRDAKRLLARTIVDDLHGKGAGEEAQRAFDRIHVEKQLPDKYPTHRTRERAIVDVLVATKLAASKGEARRKLQEGAVRVDGAVVKDPAYTFNPDGPTVLQLGKRRFVRVEFIV